MPHLSESAQAGSFDLNSNGTFIRELKADGVGALRRLSAGERRWMDEALASASQGLRRRAIDGVHEARAIDNLDEAEVIAALQGVQDHLEAVWRERQYIGEAVFRPALEIISNMTVARQAWVDGQMHQLKQMAGSAAVDPWLDGEGRQVLTRLIRHGVRLRPRPIRVIDEPEAHLHARSLAAVVTAVDAMRQSCDVVVATHSARFLQRPGWDHHRLKRRKGATRLSHYDARDRSTVEFVAHELGLTAAELLVNTNGLLFVEGRHDELILEAFFATQLESAGVRTIPFRGTENMMSIASMELVTNIFTDLAVGVMVDNVRWSQLKADAFRLSAEERSVRQFVQALEAQDRPIQVIPLAEPDIIVYLAEPAVRREFPTLSSWDRVVAEYRRTGGRDFKNWLADQSPVKIRLRTEREIRAVVDGMAAAGESPKPGLAGAVDGFCAFVTDRPDNDGPPKANEVV